MATGLREQWRSYGQAATWAGRWIPRLSMVVFGGAFFAFIAGAALFLAVILVAWLVHLAIWLWHATF